MDYSCVVRSYSVCITITLECVLPKTNLELTFAFFEQISKKSTSVLPVEFEEREVSSLRVYFAQKKLLVGSYRLEPTFEPTSIFMIAIAKNNKSLVGSFIFRQS